jgi:hypothetical protein
MTGTISTSGEGRRIAACANAGEPIYRLEMRLGQVGRGMVEEVARFLPEGIPSGRQWRWGRVAQRESTTLTS